MAAGRTVPYGFVNFFIRNIERIITCSISGKKNYHNLIKNSHKFQASVTGWCTSLSKSSEIFREKPSKVPVKKLTL